MPCINGLQDVFYFNIMEIIGMKLWKTTLFSIAALTWSTLGYSIIDVEALVGNRTEKIKPQNGESSSLDAQEMKAAVHIDPIPLVPVAFGIAFTSLDFKDDSTHFRFDSLKGTEISAEVKAWLPTPLDIDPYARLGYTLAGAYKASITGPLNQKITQTYKPSGLDLALGINWQPLPLLGILFEIDMRTNDLDAEAVNVAGFNLGGQDATSKTTSYLIGAILDL
jgi:hypothetical protein